MKTDLHIIDLPNILCYNFHIIRKGAVYIKRVKKFLKSAGVFIKAFPHFVVFELLAKLFLVSIGAPIMAYILKYTMKASGVTYLSDENLLIYLKHPATISAFIVLIFCVAFFTFVELSALAVCFACHSRRQKITVGGMFRAGLKSFTKAFRWTGIPRFLAFMLFMPIVQFTFASGQFLAPLMPIVRTVFKSVNNTAGIVAYILIQVLFIILIVDKSYSLHYLVLTENKFSDCIKKSKEIMHKNKFRMAVSLLFWSISMLAVSAVVTFGMAFIIVFIVKGFSEPVKAFRMALKVLKYAGQIFGILSSFLSVPAIMCWITQHFFDDVEETETIIIPDFTNHKMKNSTRIIITAVMIVSAGLLNITYIKALYKGNINLNMGIITKTQITAHRGYSAVAPENTLPAFEEAVEIGADYIELDVQLTADGQLVVFHDKTIERTTDGTGELSQMTYRELQKFSAGKWFSDDGEFDDVKISLLSEVLECIGNDILLNIEIKNHGDVRKTAEKTVEVIEEYGIERSCYVTSFSYTALKTVKKINPKIKTALIANVATSTSFSQLRYIDAVSLNYIFVNSSIVNMAHQNGKRVFVWTVDRKSDIQHMIAMGVDNIITNRPDRASEIITSNSISDTFLTILEKIFGS
ncbi:MAG: glycerophosphoryl diester phosphodiesterase membrane domain-containing protein [Ruminococcus sp.]|nr:glycerophosphoryl diester phosphodiesterase membrane domain-containing protein [Ruminococcus sp.]